MTTAADPTQAKPARADATHAAGSLREFEERLCNWVRSVLGDVPVVLELPRAEAGNARCVSLYLMALVTSTAVRGVQAPPLQFGVRHLVTCWGPDPGQAHHDLGELAFAAIEASDLEVDLEPLDPGTWLALALPQRPALVLQAPLRRQRVLSTARRVGAPLVLAPSAMGPLEGTLLGPQDKPVAGARVELTSLGLATRSDSQGRFRFDAVPVGGRLHLRVLARGAAQEFDWDASADPAQRPVLRMTLS